ncbi:Glycine cleavage system H protein [Ephemeroptericola cinctiostellae]|uniref:Glycine cleavage system H protein n=1 Tax=Ephemeroptericola cinctiostellae TaxID=2268024 RepID=A0A345DA09_9BURK|nr:glycine cleavage system protein GcvH [Ephemeroptericola cinctiostellae]AXF85197.1 Glycine cleavage system H protein [Ephemeroptericola cinctiostellae]
MSVNQNLKYAASHEWVKVEADGTITVGISDHAQAALGDIVFLELPEAGREVEKEEAVAVVESVKAASDIYAPVAGTVLARNDAIADTPEDINNNPYDSWLFKIKPTDLADVDGLLTAEAYAANIGE